MPRIMAFDAGAKRTGIAVTDPLKIIATALDTVDTQNLMTYIKSYLQKEQVEAFVVGYPLNMDMTQTHGTPIAEQLIIDLTKNFYPIPVHKVDERMTSKIAADTLLAAGYSKKQRQDKKRLDKISAVLILQTYLEQTTR
jgi:putative Holliday junction resolvase